MTPPPRKHTLAVRGFAVLTGLACVGLFALSGRSEPPAELPSPRAIPAGPAGLTLSASAAIRWALEHNPQLATFRKQRGIAEAAVIVSRQYPFNPIFQHFVWYGNGPANAGVTNHVFNEHTGRLDLEINHQGKYRRGTAREALTRTEWEIAAQELLISIQTARAFNNLLYRRDKYRLMEETMRFTEETSEYITKLVDQGVLRSSDLLLARADVAEARTQLGPGRGLMVVAENDLRRTLGLVGEQFNVEGTLEKGFGTLDASALVQAALERRPDLRAFEFAVREADNRLRFEIANRWGNPSLGPAFEYNETSVFFVGSWLIWSPPVINQRRGEIRQREAEKARAVQAVHQSEVQVRQDVYTALARLEQAERVTNSFRTETLPQLRQTRKGFDQLFAQGQPGVDLASLIAIRRRILRLRDAYLDALFELSQAQTDLAAAVADLSFVGCGVAVPEQQASTPSAGSQSPERANDSGD
ncbi:MAG TPA: TolC family protein [Gemmataceae bacterium]|jgi:outer membrane protein TolC